MKMMERVYQIDQMLAERSCVPRDELLERLGVSWATLKRDLAYMKGRLNAPIVFDRELGGYRFTRSEQRTGRQYELPGLWFSAEEIHALLTMQHVLSNLDRGGLLGPHIQPLLSRIAGHLGGTTDNTVEEVRRRIRIEALGVRHFRLEHFQAAGSALLRRKRLVIRYHGRDENEVTEREISPQRLVHYRDNWYLDAWCHLRRALRTFAVDAIEHAEILDRRSVDISERRLDAELGASYGIFSGRKLVWARLLFTAQRARWIASEQWHARQQAKWHKDGTYELRVPYADDRELIMDILRYGPDCKVLGPASLVQRVRDQLTNAASQYA